MIISAPSTFCWALSGISTIVRLVDGPPLTVFKGTPGSIFGLGYNGRRTPPDLAPGGSNSPVLGGADEYFDTSYERDPDQCSSSVAFCAPPSRALGTLGRNTLIGPGIANVDLALAKNTPIGEYVNLQFRAEFFNIFNRANFAIPEDDFGAQVDRGNAGLITETSTTNRQIQFSLRVEF